MREKWWRCTCSPPVDRFPPLLECTYCLLYSTQEIDFNDLERVDSRLLNMDYYPDGTDSEGQSVDESLGISPMITELANHKKFETPDEETSADIKNSEFQYSVLAARNTSVDAPILEVGHVIHGDPIIITEDDLVDTASTSDLKRSLPVSQGEQLVQRVSRGNTSL